MIFGGIWLVVGSVLGAGFATADKPFWDDLILDQRGATADALVLRVERTGVSVNEHPVAEVVLRYEQHDAAWYTTRPPGEGETVRVEYDPQNPQRVRREGESASVMGFFLLLPFGFALTGAVLFGLGVVQTLRTRAIYVNGDAARGTVTGVAPTNMHLNNQRVYKVTYTFNTMTRGSAQGSFRTVRPPNPESSLWVLYQTDTPVRNVPWTQR